jgi:Zn-finger nucleic acid-binding protein
LVASERVGVPLEYCPQCHGVWLERGSLDKIIDRSLDESAELSHFNTDHRTGYDRIAYGDRIRSLNLSMYDTTA